MLIFIYHPNSSSSILIAPVRKHKKWKHFVQLHHRKPVSVQRKRKNAMVLIMVIIQNLTSIRFSPVGAAQSKSAFIPCPQEVSRRLLSTSLRGNRSRLVATANPQATVSPGACGPNCMEQFSCPDTRSLLKAMAGE